jgi:hypothetical protein
MFSENKFIYIHIDDDDDDDDGSAGIWIGNYEKIESVDKKYRQTYGYTIYKIVMKYY